MTYMVRATLTPLGLRQLAGRGRLDDEYARHQLVWDVLRPGPNAERNFLYRWDDDGTELPRFYAVTKTEPTPNADLPFVVDSKPYEPALDAGEKLTFLLRANPVVKKRNEEGRQTRHDVVMDFKRSLRKSGTTPPDDVVREAGLRWLEARAAEAGFAFDPDAVLVHSHRQLDFRKRRNGRRIQLSTLDFEGRLTVSNSDAFASTLLTGLGPAKAYGCGLLLVRR